MVEISDRQLSAFLISVHGVVFVLSKNDGVRPCLMLAPSVTYTQQRFVSVFPNVE